MAGNWGCAQTVTAIASNVDLRPTANSSQEINPLIIGDSIPAVQVTPLTDNNKVDLSIKVREKPSVIVFYRGGWCMYCNMQLQGLKDVYPQLTEMGYQLLAISPDKPEKLQESLDNFKLDYSLFSDSGMEAARAFGISFRVDDETVEKYHTYGIDLEAASGQKHHWLPVPAIFIVGTDGKIKYSYVNPDYATRLDTQVLLAMAKSALMVKRK